MRMKTVIKLILPIFVLVIILGIYIFYRNVSNNVISTTNSVNRDIESDKHYFEKLILTVVRHKANYDTLPLTKNFKQKFKDGVFEIKIGDDINAGYEDSFPYTSDREKCTMWLWTFETNNETWFRKIHYIYNENYELDDLELIEKRLIMDANGYGPRYDRIYVYGNSDYESRNIIGFLFEPFTKSRYDKFDTTKHFKEKFPEVERNEPIKIDRSYLCMRKIVANGKKFNIELYDENSYYEYEIEILTDKNGAVDDMIYKYIKTFDGDGNNLEIYQNRIDDDVYKSNEW